MQYTPAFDLRNLRSWIKGATHTYAAFRTFVTSLLDNKSQLLATAGSISQRLARIWAEPLIEFSRFRTWVSRISASLSFWTWPLLLAKICNHIYNGCCFPLQVKLELPRDYTSHYLCKQVPWLVAVLCRKPHGYMNDFNFDAISGQIRSLLEEDSLKDVNISFGWVVPDSKYLSIIGTWLSINITAVWNDEKWIHSTFMLKMTSGMSWVRNWS